MKSIILIALLSMSGCARFSTVQSDTSYDAEGIITRSVRTKAAAWTFVAGSSALASWKATQDDTSQGASVGGLRQDTDVGPIVEGLARGAVEGAVRGAIKP